MSEQREDISFEELVTSLTIPFDDPSQEKMNQLYLIEKANKLERNNPDPDIPIYMLVVYQNEVNPNEKAVRAIRYEQDSVNQLLILATDPTKAWENYRTLGSTLDSDGVAILAQANDEAEPKIWSISRMGPISFGEMYMNEDQRWMINVLMRGINNLRVGEGPSRRHSNGSFMRWGLDRDKLQASSSAVATFWKNLTDKSFLESELQIPWFTRFNDPLREEEEGDKPIVNDIYRVPCALFAMKSQVDKDSYERLCNNTKFAGQGTPVSAISKACKKLGYKFIIYRIRRKKEKGEHAFQVEHKTPVEEGVKGTVQLMFWEGHWMRYKEVRLPGSRKPVCVIRLFELMKQEGLLFPYNGFEVQSKYDCFSYDSQLTFDDKLWLQRTPNNYEFSEQQYDSPEWKETSSAPRAIYFADFECTTDEEFHRPYMLCAQGFANIDGQLYDRNVIKNDNTDITGVVCFKGEDCAKQFLKYLAANHYVCKERRKKPDLRIYFYNLAYDCRFMLPHLRGVSWVRKGGMIYSCKGTYCGYNGKKLLVELWDALPLFMMPLKKAGMFFLPEEKKDQIKKEVFPYKMYTYSNFDSSDYGWVNVERAKSYFAKEEEYEEFYVNLEKTLPPKPGKMLDLKTHHIEEGYISNMFKRVEGKEQFNMWEYAKFYCSQDVRVLSGIMIYLGQLLAAKEVEGVRGTPPFSQNILEFRTASSLSYNYFLKTVLFKQDENKKWVPRYPIAFPKRELRAIIQKTVRGGRVMTRDNLKWYYKAGSLLKVLQDYDAVSLYPSAMSKLWVSEGIPKLIKKEDGGHLAGKVPLDEYHARFCWTSDDFKRWFATPEDEHPENKRYKDGCIHLTCLHTKKCRHFPLLCVKDKRTKLNDYKNYEKATKIDTWVNAIDLYNLIDFQDAYFEWDAAVVWEGQRHYEIRDSIKNLFDFRNANHCKGFDHPIQNVAKLMMNSIYGKSTLKACDKEKILVDVWRWRTNKDSNQYEIYNYWREYFNANAYRIHSFTLYDTELGSANQVEVVLYKRDISSNFNIFGSNVLAMARRLIGRVMALAEDVEEEHPEMSPGLFYTDTDSMHIRQDLLNLVVPRFREVYGWDIMGRNLCQFHIDFDAPKNFQKGEDVLGANESWFLAKKMYADQLLGNKGTKGYHLRMKGIPSELVKYEHYKDIYENEPVEYDLLSNGRVSFFYKKGKVGCRSVMKRVIKTKVARAREEGVPDDVVTKKPRVEEPLSESDKGSSEDEEGYETDDTVPLPLNSEDELDVPSSQAEVDDVIIID